MSDDNKSASTKVLKETYGLRKRSRKDYKEKDHYDDYDEDEKA